MFTGLVEEVGRIQNIRRGSRSCVLTVACSEVLQGSRIGDSIAVNGVCLTATAIGSGYFTADAMPETLDRSSLGQLGPGSPVNLERAMPADGRFGGHIVSGHIDGTGIIRSLEQDDNAVWYTIAASPEVLRYIVEKGSITIDGISLTVAYVDEEVFKVSIIPHTREVTALSSREAGSVVNLECDIVGKYIEKLMRPYSGETAEKKTESRISEAFLMENGFL